MNSNHERPVDGVFIVSLEGVLGEKDRHHGNVLLCPHYDFKDAHTLSEMMLNDPEDLIHKTVGWMLRDILKA